MPTAQYPLSLFSLVPTGKERITVEMTPTGHTASFQGKETDLAVISLDEVAGPSTSMGISVTMHEGKGAIMQGRWLGVEGPNVHVGPMR